MREDGNLGQIAFCDSLTIRDVSGFKEILMNRFRDSDEVYLEFSAEAAVDFSAIQLIESTRRYASGREKRFGLANPPHERLTELLEQGGFLEQLSPEGRVFWRVGEMA